jgi:HK97 gp10 family phage protein
MSDASHIAGQITFATQQFKKYDKNVQGAIKDAVLRGVLKIERSAKLIFRSKKEESWNGSPPRVQTGRARMAITHELDESPERGVVGVVGLNVEYAVGLEIGTDKTWPHPFMSPAYDEHKDAIIKDIAEAVKDGDV